MKTLYLKSRSVLFLLFLYMFFLIYTPVHFLQMTSSLHEIGMSMNNKAMCIEVIEVNPLCKMTISEHTSISQNYYNFFNLKEIEKNFYIEEYILSKINYGKYLFLLKYFILYLLCYLSILLYRKRCLPIIKNLYLRQLYSNGILNPKIF